jgi:hypothetical protein
MLRQPRDTTFWFWAACCGCVTVSVNGIVVGWFGWKCRAYVILRHQKRQFFDGEIGLEEPGVVFELGGLR